MRKAKWILEKQRHYFLTKVYFSYILHKK